jgi:hypothetical protein
MVSKQSTAQNYESSANRNSAKSYNIGGNSSNHERLTGARKRREVKYMSQADWDNYSRQLNDENDAYWQSRGYDGHPDD